ncbi:MAG TPA: hypothetical protein DCL77_14215 [Prolixibacteraceae bacterium]|nr:hypothetical protein [Prolixibacteraceae bacterium]
MLEQEFTFIVRNWILFKPEGGKINKYNQTFELRHTLNTLFNLEGFNAPGFRFQAACRSKATYPYNFKLGTCIQIGKLPGT